MAASRTKNFSTRRSQIMRRDSHMGSMLPVATLMGLTHLGMSVAGDPFLVCTTDVRAVLVQPANSPVLMTIRIANRSDAAIKFSIASGSAYPQASLFTAKITDA